MRLIFGFLLAFALAGCDREAPVDTPPPAEKAQGINWFEGSVEQAFQAARQQRKPLFLYWGADWCPPCHELKATVFQQADFIQASQRFVAVELDGDETGAQQLGQQYGVMGYPTLVVFNADGQELTRIPNGLDLQAYANILHIALDNLQPIDALMDDALAAEASLPAGHCAVLARHSWGQSARDYPPKQLLQVFSAASELCDSSAAGDRASLLLLYLQQMHGMEAVPPEADRAALLTQLQGYLSQAELVKSNMYLWLSSAPAMLELFGPDNTALHRAFAQAYRKISQSDSNTLFVRIQSLRGLLELELMTSEALAEPLRRQILAFRDQAQEMDRSDARFHATINATGNLLREAGLLTQAKELLSEEIERSKYPYYFMLELAAVEQLLGDEAAALQRLQQAWENARGPATRFQWGVNYLSGLLDMDAGNQARIDTSFQQLLGELDEGRVFYQRSGVRMQKLDSAFREWAGENPQRRSALQNYRSTVEPLCDKIAPGLAKARENCEGFLLL